MNKTGIQRNSRGHLLIEMIAALPMLLATTALSLNGAFALLAVSVLDETCIDAARAACSESDAALALQRAEAAARMHEKPGICPTVQLLEFNTFEGDYLKGPYLVLQTTVEYQMPFNLSAFGTSIAGRKLSMVRQYAYPILPVPENPLLSPTPALRTMSDIIDEG